MSEPSPTPQRKRRGRLLRLGAALAVLLALAGYLTVQYLTGGAGGPGCKVVSGKEDGASYEFTPEQAVNAATIAAVGSGRGMPERAVTIALATALQESGLRNIRHGDRDSLGLFQQRPSQGWGTPKEIMDPTYSAGIFYEHLAKVPGYTRLPLTVAAQRVQRSGYPQAYAKHEPDATLLAAALTGRAAATLTCQGRPGATRSTGPDAVRAALVRDFGREVVQEAGAEVGDAGADGGRTGAAGSAASAGTGTAPASDAAPSPAAGTGSGSGTGGRTVTLPVRGGGGAGAAAGRDARQRGWQLAHWAVANASALHIERVSYAGQEWTAGITDSQWRRTEAEGAAGSERAAGAVRITTGR
ncbi:heavy metal transporter [Streptomyces sp. NPDC004065]|uniref:heavy metal transporter n=1 Tax=Streptomyces sp. NPDC004065 TaxID=3364689 RepID=UPI00384E512D